MKKENKNNNLLEAETEKKKYLFFGFTTKKTLILFSIGVILGIIISLLFR